MRKVVSALVGCTALFAGFGCGGDAGSESPKTMSVASEELQARSAHASTCTSGLTGAINLPADDSVHPYSEYSDEWWYYSSHLQTQDGRQLGFVQIVYTSLDPT